MKNLLLLLLLFTITISSCKKDEVIYGLTSTDILQPSANKDILKTPSQYLAVLHVDLFQKPISTTEQAKLNKIVRSVGDKRLIYGLIISNYLNRTDVILPSETDMRSDLKQFIKDTYVKFYVRNPTELELEYYVNYLENNPNITPELVYYAFAISDEFFFY